jgi:hypothetical protein
MADRVFDTKHLPEQETRARDPRGPPDDHVPLCVSPDGERLLNLQPA